MRFDGIADAKARLRQVTRRHVRCELHDVSGTPPSGVAIYALSDPRDIRTARYVGRTQAPRRRFIQHLNTARLWLPDERPWWVRTDALRPLYQWIRELYLDGERLPVMVITHWSAPGRRAIAAERARIIECFKLDSSLLNVEAQLHGPQLPLF